VRDIPRTIHSHPRTLISLTEYGPIDDELKRVLAHERPWSVAAGLLADQFLGDAACVLLCSFHEVLLFDFFRDSHLSKTQAVDIVYRLIHIVAYPKLNEPVDIYHLLLEVSR
jgi:hypothetical protein